MFRKALKKVGQFYFVCGTSGVVSIEFNDTEYPKQLSSTNASTTVIMSERSKL